jgi:ribosome-associated heat shock protein Hsp15
MNERHRIDVWLKLVCLVKHRGEAAEACRGGHVKINAQRVKPATAVRENDVVEVLQGDHYRRVIVKGLPEKQVSKEVARTMYIDETPKPQVDIARGVFRERGSGRPTKRQRRDIERLKR